MLIGSKCEATLSRRKYKSSFEDVFSIARRAIRNGKHPVTDWHGEQLRIGLRSAIRKESVTLQMVEILKITLLIILIGCAIAVNLTPSLLQAVVIFMSYSSIMCILWILMESPDLAITEAAVGAGVSGILFLVTLKKIRREDSAEPGETEDEV